MVDISSYFFSATQLSKHHHPLNSKYILIIIVILFNIDRIVLKNKYIYIREFNFADEGDLERRNLFFKDNFDPLVRR